jgi:hypothetical protein
MAFTRMDQRQSEDDKIISQTLAQRRLSRDTCGDKSR